jgi:isoleucyl-tRNA synthetase
LKRRASQTVIFETIVSLLKIMAPVLSSTADEMWSYLGYQVEGESVLLTAFPVANPELIDEALEQEWESIWRIREQVNKKIEEKRALKEIGHSLDTKVVITAGGDELKVLRKVEDDLKNIFIVSQAELKADLKEGGELDIVILKAEGRKCERCWQYAVDIRTEGPFPNVCGRCEDILSSL